MVSLVWLVALIAFIVAFAIGANDESQAPTVGCGVLSLMTAVMLGAMLSAFGAIILGGSVATTIGKNMVKEEFHSSFTMDLVLIVLISISVWLILASWFGTPMSTTQAVVGAMLGIGIWQLGGLHTINQATILRILLSWAISPVIGFVIAFLSHKGISRYLLSRAKGLRARERFEGWLAKGTFVVVLVTSISRGGNDVANATAPLLQAGPELAETALILGAIGMGAGLLVVGRKVVRELGQNLTNLSPSTAFSSSVSTALIMFFGTRAGLPLSGTHVLVLSFVGVSVAAREKIKLETLRAILLSWGLTVPACAILSGLFAKAYFAIV